MIRSVSESRPFFQIRKVAVAMFTNLVYQTRSVCHGYS
jgi:hypothetical protein